MFCTYKKYTSTLILPSANPILQATNINTLQRHQFTEIRAVLLGMTVDVDWLVISLQAPEILIN